MKTFLIRSASAVVYAGLLIAGCVYWTPLLFMALALFLLLGLNELGRLLNTEISPSLFALWSSFCLMVFIDFVIVINPEMGFLFYYPWISYVLIPVPFALLFIILLTITVSKQPVRSVLSFMSLSLLYLVVPLLTMVLLQYQSFAPGLSWLMVVLAAVWINDTMAYITGSLIGKHKLAERISPSKTWEGVLGGWFFTTIIILIVNNIWFDKSVLSLIAFTFIIVVAGVMGDLLESRLKREAGVKDSGTLMPGHGGILDRLDSMLVVAPFALIAILFIFGA